MDLSPGLRFIALAVCLSGMSANAFAQSANADDPAVQEIDEYWRKCQAISEISPDRWIGWQQTYTTSFKFFDRRLMSSSVSLVQEQIQPDAMSQQTNTYCFRPDNTLAFIHTWTNAPSVADQDQMYSREGWLYFNAEGEQIRTLGWMVDAEYQRLGGLDAQGYELTQACGPIDLYRSLDEVDQAVAAKLGDENGKSAGFTPQQVEWCDLAVTE